MPYGVSLSPPLEKGGEPTANPLNQLHSPLGRGKQLSAVPLWGKCWGADERQGLPYGVSLPLVACPLTLAKFTAPIFPFTAQSTWYKCALIYQLRWYVRPTGFLQNSNLSKHREMCSHSLRSLGYISRLLGSILRPLFQLDIYGEREPPMDSHKWQPLTPLHYVPLFSPKGASPLMDTPERYNPPSGR